MAYEGRRRKDGTVRASTTITPAMAERYQTIVRQTGMTYSALYRRAVQHYMEHLDRTGEIPEPEPWELHENLFYVRAASAKKLQEENRELRERLERLAKGEGVTA